MLTREIENMAVTCQVKKHSEDFFSSLEYMNCVRNNEQDLASYHKEVGE